MCLKIGATLAMPNIYFYLASNIAKFTLKHDFILYTIMFHCYEYGSSRTKIQHLKNNK